MKTLELRPWLGCLLALLSLRHLAAEESAEVKENRVNVRGQPSLNGEVITQLKKGEKVVVLEEVTTAKGKVGEPLKWARIQMPANTPVWVFAPYLDPTNKTVRVTRLNLRAGPGENYSVVGRLERGTAVTEIRRADKWIEIETPAGAYGFVAANLLTKAAGTAAMSPAPTPPPVPPPSTPKEAVPAPAQPSETESRARLSHPPAESSPAPAAEKPAESAAPNAPATTTPPPVTSAPPPPALPEPTPAPAVVNPPAAQPAVPSATTPKAEEPIVHRVVRREGIVRSTVSIQAPTYYELLSPQNHKTINYLHMDKLGLDLNDYRGRRVIVTGEEAIDSRWKNTPVIEVEKLELIP